MAKSNSQRKRSSVPRVFISSTVADLEPYRAAAREAAIAVGMLPVMCEDFAASDHRPPLDEFLARVKETDVLIVLSAHRYGWIPDDQPKTKPRKSITWLEFQQAVDKDCEVLVFLIGHDGEWATEINWLTAGLTFLSYSKKGHQFKSPGLNTSIGRRFPPPTKTKVIS